jgi:anti-sigma factor (TIGR02949 family)
VAFFDSLKRLFSGTGQKGRSGGTASSGSSGSPDETAVAMITCDEASARLFEYLDGELEGLSEEEVRNHLAICEGCFPRVQFERHFIEALQRSQNGGRVSGSLRERVLRAVAEDERPD